MGDATTVAAAAADLGPAAPDEQREIQLGSIQDHPDPGAEKDAVAARQGNGVRAAANGLKKPASVSGAGDGARAAKEKSHSLKKGCSPTAVLTPRLKASRSNFTVPQPFSLTTEKRATLAGSQSGSKPTVNGTSKPSQKSTPSKADSHATTKSFSTPSPSSENVGSTPKSRSEFVFRSVERAQKRMEFYANLTEKTKAREAERNRIQASTQQQVAAEIKKLRKDQTFKATPMPKFYQEPPPVRIDVKKTPPTRPKSPKLGRRGSSNSSTDAPPKIIARRSSDEYDVSKLPEQLHTLDVTQVAASEDHSKAETLVLPKPLDTADVGSDNSSRKSDNLVPKAALSEDEDHRLRQEELPPADPQAQEAEDHSHSMETSRSSNESPASAVAEDLDAALQLPVSSSLLDDVYDEDGHQEVESEDDHDEFPSPTSVGGDHDEENVRVYISEEFRQAAALFEQEVVEEEEGVLRSNGEEEEDEDDGPKVYVNMDGIRAEREEELKHA